MPRKPKDIRRPKPRSEAEKRPPATHQEVIATLIKDHWGVFRDGADHELLAAYPPRERERIVGEANAEMGRRQRAERLPLLRERLGLWPVWKWREIFQQEPELEDSLTPAQRREWEQWRAEQKGEKSEMTIEELDRRSLTTIELLELQARGMRDLKERQDGLKKSQDVVDQNLSLAIEQINRLLVAVAGLLKATGLTPEEFDKAQDAVKEHYEIARLEGMFNADDSGKAAE